MKKKFTNSRPDFTFRKTPLRKRRDKTTKKVFALRLVGKLSRSTLVTSGISSLLLGIEPTTALHDVERADRSQTTRGKHNKKTHALKCQRRFGLQEDRDGRVRRLLVDAVSIEQKFDLMHGAFALETSL